MTRRNRWLLVILAGVALAVAARGAGALSIGQVDTFEDGTTQGWIVNALGMGAHPKPPVQEPSGGPAGADDGFLLLTAVGGAGAGQHLTVLNPSQWAGDYTAAGITAIRMDLINLGATDLSIRLLFEDPIPGPPANQALTNAVLLPAGSGWTSAVFAVTAADLTALLGSADAALTGATVLRIVHAPDAAFPGPAIAATLGVDDIEAVPEPGTAALLALGLTALGAARRRRAQLAAATRRR